MSSDLKQKAVRGAGWLAFGQMARQLVNLVLMGVLARLVLPDAFGLIAMAGVLTGLCEVFQDIGLSAAVIQRKDVTEQQLTTVFYLSVAWSTFLAALTVALSPLVAAFYNKPEIHDKIMYVTMLMGLNFISMGLVSIHGTLLKKRLEFGKLTVIGFIVTVVSGVLGIILAFTLRPEFRVYALVAQSLSREAMNVGALWWAVGWRPKGRPSLKSVKGLLRYGANVTVQDMLTYAHQNIDPILIGRFLDAASLGVYSIAKGIMILPIRRISVTVVQVAFPAFSAVQDDLARIRRGFLQMISPIALTAFPMMAGIAIVTPEAVRALLGPNPKWERATFIIQVLAPIGALQALSAVLHPMFRALNRVSLQLRLSVLEVVIVLGAQLVGIHWKIEGMAVSYALAQVMIMLPLWFYAAFSMVELSFGEFFGAVRAPLLGTLVMAAVVAGARFAAMRWAGISGLALLCIEIPLGAAAYVGSLRVISPTIFAETISLVRLIRNRSRANTAPAAPNAAD